MASEINRIEMDAYFAGLMLAFLLRREVSLYSRMIAFERTTICCALLTFSIPLFLHKTRQANRQRRELHISGILPAPQSVGFRSSARSLGVVCTKTAKLILNAQVAAEGRPIGIIERMGDFHPEETCTRKVLHTYQVHSTIRPPVRSF